MTSPSLAILRLQTDERLIALVRAGHERAFEAIVERHRRALLRYARRLVGDARAEDAVQQALVSAWAALRRGDDVRELSAWLHRIVHNTGLNSLRGQRDDVAELRDSVLAGGAPHEVLERQLVVRETLETVAALPERQREALLRIAVEGRSQEEVAESLGLTHGAVRQLVHRARTAVRAAATAVTPLPAATWLASLSTRAEPVAGRIAELVGGAGSAGIGATLAKAGTIAVLAGAAAAEPGLVNHDRPPEVTAAVEAEPRASSDDPRLGSGGLSNVAGDTSGPSDSRGSGGEDSSGDSGGRGSARSGDDSSGPGSGESSPGDSGSSRSGGSGSSGSGSSGSGSGGSDSSGSSSDGSGSSGSGSSGSGSSGSGSSGSGSSGSGSSGSGSSGSGSSGSGSSGSGSSGSGSGGSGSSGSGSGSSGSGSGSDDSD